MLAPSRNALQTMTKICEQYANIVSLKFSTNVNVQKSKTKCIIFHKGNLDTNNIAPVILNGLPLPYVNSVVHLGNTLEVNNSMTKDCNIKRAKFISKVHSLNQEFYFAHPNTVIELYNIYTCSFYGSNLWELYSDNVNKLYSSWNTAVKVLFKLPYSTHRYFIEPISEINHVKTMLCSRFIAFNENLRSSPKLCIRLLFNMCKNDARTILCKNVTNIERECGLSRDILSKQFVKKTLKFSPVHQDNVWKVNIVKELLAIKFNDVQVDNFTHAEIDHMISFLCTD